MDGGCALLGFIPFLSITHGEPMSTKVPRDLPDAEHQALKIAAAPTNRSVHQWGRDAMSEKIWREHASASWHAPNAEANETDVPAKADEKPA